MSLTWLCQAPVTEHFERSCNGRFAWKEACRNTGCIKWLGEQHRSRSGYNLSLSWMINVPYAVPGTRCVRAQAAVDAHTATLYVWAPSHTEFALGERRTQAFSRASLVVSVSAWAGRAAACPFDCDIQSADARSVANNIMLGSQSLPSTSLLPKGARLWQTGSLVPTSCWQSASSKCSRSTQHLSRCRSSVARLSTPKAVAVRASDSEASTVSSWDGFAASASGEWEGVTATFDPR